MINNISFCISVRADDEILLRQCVAGILRQNVPDFEILGCGKQYGSDPGYNYFRNDEWVERGEINKIRNYLCTNAKKQFIVLIDDNVELGAGWYQAINSADCLDIIGSRVTTEKNARVIDWAYQMSLGSKTLPFPLEYDEWTTKAYVWGGLMMIRRTVLEHLKFDEKRREGEEDDVDFCLRASRMGYRIGVFPEAEAKCLEAAGRHWRCPTFEKSQTQILTFRKHVAAGQEAFNTKDYSGALVNLVKAAEMAPGDPELLSLIGWAHYFCGNYTASIDCFFQVTEIEPENDSVLRGRGWAYLQTGSYESAISDLSRALELLDVNRRSDWLEAVRGLSWANYHCGNMDVGIKHFNSLLENSRSDEIGLRQDVYRGLGWCYYRKGLLSEAADNFNQALSTDARAGEVMPDIKRGLELIRTGCVGKTTAYGHGPGQSQVETAIMPKPRCWSSALRKCKQGVAVFRRTVRKVLDSLSSDK